MRGRIRSILKITIPLAIIGSLAFLHKELIWSIRYALHQPKQLAIYEPAPLPKCPDCNIVLISMDTLRADHLGFLGSQQGLTPHLDQIAARSIAFPNAFANAFFTTPSHMTVFTSLYPQIHRVESTRVKLPGNPRSENRRRRLNKRYVTLTQALKENGYHTVWNGPLKLNHLSLKDGFERGFDEFRASPFRSLLSFDAHPVETFDESSLTPLIKRSKKTFLFLHSYLTHLPYLFHPPDIPRSTSQVPYVRDELMSRIAQDIQLDAKSIIRIPEQSMPSGDLAEAGRICSNWQDMKPCFARFLSEDRFWQAVGQWQLHKAKRASRQPEEVEVFRAAYASGVRLLDREIGEFWQRLETSGALKNTIVIFFSDHGEALFENGEGSHSTFLEHTARVPLLLYHPKVSAGLRIDQMVSLVDIMPSTLSLLGLPIPKQVQGVSIDESRPPIVTGFSLGNDYIRSSEWKLTRSFSGSEELFYLPLDPAEKMNLVNLLTPWSRAAYTKLKGLRDQKELERVL